MSNNPGHGMGKSRQMEAKRQMIADEFPGLHKNKCFSCMSRRWMLLSFLVVALAVVVASLLLFKRGDLGVSAYELHAFSGQRADEEILKNNTRIAAGDFLIRHKAELMGEAHGRQELVLDYSKSSEIRSMGYRSSFYYHHWNIFLPYTVRSDSGETGVVIVQLSDAVAGMGHDPRKFHVIRALFLDRQDKLIKQWDRPSDAS
jgi:hypothetical protein